MLDREVKKTSLACVIDQYRSEGIDPIVIKGWSIDRFYPDERPRSYTDIDLAVSPTDFDRAAALLECPEFRKFNVDLHCGLRDRDPLIWDELFERSFTVELNGVSVRVLGEEDNLRVTAAHWLIDGGVYKDRLWDLFYLITNRKGNFDWNRCLNAAGPVRRTWVIAAVATARDYLEVDVSDLPESVKNAELPDWYKRALDKEWQRGPYLRMPLWLCIGKPKLFIEQVQRRFPPNPIAATTDTEGMIDDSGRLKYQARSIARKIPTFFAGLRRVSFVKGK